MLCKEREEQRECMYLTYLTYLTYKRGFYRSTVVYLKDYSPYPDSSLLVVNLRI